VDAAQIAITLIVYLVQKSMYFLKERKKEAKSMENILNEGKTLVEIYEFIGLLLKVVYFMPVHGEFKQLNN
jgi:predicted small integral membrane protein